MGSCVHSPGRSAAGRSALTGVALGLLLTGCAVGGAEVEPASPAPRADLAREAEVAAANVRDEPAGKAAATGGSLAGQDGSGRPGGARAEADRASDGGDVPVGAGGDAPDQPGRAGPWSPLAELDDPAGDHGDGPAYADLSGVAFAERGGSVSVSVRLGQTVPGTLARREVQGVGIDLYRSSDVESDYQVFLDGGVHGWRAFLQTPHGFVDFPGTFRVSARDLQVTVPWSALGGRRAATAAVFVDWSEGTGRLAADGTTRVDLRPS